MIDRATINQILDAADVVDVVSDFVSLRRRGSNYTGLCPFHNEKTPSFSVSRAKGIYKCFGCGKAGSAVNFVMEHEHMTYVEALKYLAKKYHIEVHERELSDEEKQQQTERESMLVVNEFANQFFEDTLHNTDDGRNIGLTYFYERSLSDETIKTFHLGYSPDNRTALYDAATGKGYNRKFLFSTGVCTDDNHGGGFDRFRGRVMFPFINIAGKVIGFGGRTLKQDHAKYLNSPESILYVKNRELYGIFQAKREISKQDKCYLVEGYFDVISMYQSGIQNVVASSGTSLTDGQVRMIHRFTDNVTVLYDGDSAGIHASLRGIDMLLAEGLNVKVALLPDGEDPDSFARTHSASELQQFITDAETDFITFKVNILLSDAKNDPIKKAQVVADVVKSISVIPSQITRAIYAKECSRMLDVQETILLSEIGKMRNKQREEEYKRRQRTESKENRQGGTAENGIDTGAPVEAAPSTPPSPDMPPTIMHGAQQHEAHIGTAKSKHERLLYPQEENLIRYVAKFGMCYFCNTQYADGTERATTVVEYVNNELTGDNIEFTHPVFKQIFQYALQILPDYYTSLNELNVKLEQEMKQRFEEGVAELRDRNLSYSDIEKEENSLQEMIYAETQDKIATFSINFFERRICSVEDDAMRKTAINLVSEKYQLSQIHTKFAHVQTDYERLFVLVPEAINNWKNAIVQCHIMDIQEEMRASGGDTKDQLERLNELYQRRRELAKLIGDRVVNPI